MFIKTQNYKDISEKLLDLGRHIATIISDVSGYSHIDPRQYQELGENIQQIKLPIMARLKVERADLEDGNTEKQAEMCDFWQRFSDVLAKIKPHINRLSFEGGDFTQRHNLKKATEQFEKTLKTYLGLRSSREL